jgi:hypothetical protein
MSEERTPILRLGEWMDQHIGTYHSLRTVLVPDPDNYDVNKIVFRKETLHHIEPHRLVQLFRDYDKYVDDNFNL